ARWANVRLLKIGDLGQEVTRQLEFRSIPGGLLVQERDLAHAAHFNHAAGPEPTKEQTRAAAFLESICRFLFSNAIVIGGGGSGGSLRMFGAGAGQMDRVTSCRLAVEKAGKLATGGVAFSDAFFPFPDGP